MKRQVKLMTILTENNYEVANWISKSEFVN